ncbi:MAG: hypothetical protein CM1200mP23_0040 [Nitrososphaerota archaeon]|nr:MAG: hypothetical protein CM1200mP23_0040 [Nitrososphaerota archaeon]
MQILQIGIAEGKFEGVDMTPEQVETPLNMEQMEKHTPTRASIFIEFAGLGCCRKGFLICLKWI